MKQELISPPILQPPHWDRPFILMTDASGYRLGAILAQLDDKNNEHPIAFASRKLQLRELRLSTIEKEFSGDSLLKISVIIFLAECLNYKQITTH